MKLSDLSETVHLIAPAHAPVLLFTGEYPKDEDRPDSGLNSSLEEARNQLTKAKEALEQTKSDMAYWTQRGMVTGWQVVVNLLEAASLVGEDNLPDIDPPDITGKVVMDAQHYLQKWSEQVLAEAKKMCEVNN